MSSARILSAFGIFPRLTATLRAASVQLGCLPLIPGFEPPQSPPHACALSAHYCQSTEILTAGGRMAEKV